MSKLSNYSENALVNHMLRGSAYTYTQVYLAAHTGDPGETGSNELAGGNYARVPAPTFGAAASRSITNTSVVRFPLLVAAVGTITHISAWDAPSGGNLLWYSSAMSSSVITAVGRVPTIAVGGITISLSGEISTYAANKWLDLMFNNQAWSTPSPHATLHTADPGLTGANEVSENAYARVAVSTWNSPSDGATANTSAITFTTPSPSDWGTVTHMGIFDASTSGNFLFSANLDTSYLTSTSETPTVAAGDFDVVVQ